MNIEVFFVGSSVTWKQILLIFSPNMYILVSNLYNGFIGHLKGKGYMGYIFKKS